MDKNQISSQFRLNESKSGSKSHREKEIGLMNVPKAADQEKEAKAGENSILNFMKSVFNKKK